MAEIYLDTHVVIWMRLGASERFSKRALESIEQNSLIISPFVKLELYYLFEIGRIVESPNKIIDDLSDAIGLEEKDISSSRLITAASLLSWTRDPFDRLIAAQCIADKCGLITKDGQMLNNLKKAIW